MIFFTGDCHSEFGRFTKKAFPEQVGLTKEDVVVICGDFGGVWEKIETSREKYWLDWLDGKPFTTVFVDGNHENFDRLSLYLVKEWNGGKVHEIRPSVLHLMRGEVFTVCGKTIFAFGGAASHDVKDGILDIQDPVWHKKAKLLDRQGKRNYRVRGVSWWEEELPSDAEMENGLRNLRKYGNEVDYVVTHSPSGRMLQQLGKAEMNVLTEYLDLLHERVKYSKWFAGHVHMNRTLADGHHKVLKNEIWLEVK